MMDHDEGRRKTDRDGDGSVQTDPESSESGESSGGSYYYDDATGYEVYDEDDDEVEPPGARN